MCACYVVCVDVHMHCSYNLRNYAHLLPHVKTRHMHVISHLHPTGRFPYTFMHCGDYAYSTQKQCMGYAYQLVGHSQMDYFIYIYTAHRIGEMLMIASMH